MKSFIINFSGAFLLLFAIPICQAQSNTIVTTRGDRWCINGQFVNQGSASEGLLLNVRMVNSVFEDRGTNMPEEFHGFNAGGNTEEFIEKIPEYVKSGVNAFTISLQGGSPGYEGAVNTAFEDDGSLRRNYMKRVASVIKAADRNGAVIILSCFYQRQHSHSSALNGRKAIENALLNVGEWIKRNRFQNVIIEISNEYLHGGYENWKDGEWLASPEGQVDLIGLVKSKHPDLITGTSGMGDGTMNEAVANAADYITIHFNSTKLKDYSSRIGALRKYDKPVICNEDDKTGNEGAAALRIAVANGCGWGYMNNAHNQTIPFHFDGVEDDTAVYRNFRLLSSYRDSSTALNYYPLADTLGGWRILPDARSILKVTGMDKRKLDDAFQFNRTTTRNGGLLVLKDGWLIYENYWGMGQREATPNLGSCGKSFTSIAVGILMKEHPALFPDGLDQKIFTPRHLPGKAFPLPDPRMADIRLGQLLSFTAGIRGNNPVWINGRSARADTVGPDGWYALVDEYALGKKDGIMNGIPFTTGSLWCDPGKGYSYSTASMHIASIMLRHIAGIELEEYIMSKIAVPLGWGRWGYGYKNQKAVTHTPGGGGIALRSTDMLRFGYLLLQKGKWNTDQVVPEDYVLKATMISPYNPHYPYSLQFNVNTDGQETGIPCDAFWKIGSGGHCLYVVPSLNLVIWKLGGRDDQYNTSNTGLPEPDPVRNFYGPTEKPVSGENDYIKLLKMVIDAQYTVLP